MAAGTLVSSGTSLNIPSGSGSERLRRASIHTLNNQWQEILSGTAGHIYTILSIIFCEQAGTTGKVQARVNNGTNDILIYSDNIVVPLYGSFVWNDKFVLEEDDDLDVYCQSANGHFWVSYIDQDWT